MEPLGRAKLMQGSGVWGCAPESLRLERLEGADGSWAVL